MKQFLLITFSIFFGLVMGMFIENETINPITPSWPYILVMVFLGISIYIISKLPNDSD